MKPTFALPADAVSCVLRHGDVLRGIPQKAMFPNLPVRIGGEEFVVDILVRLDYPGHDPQLVVIEFDENGVTPESARLERLLSQVGIQVVRVTPEDIFRPDYQEHLDGMIHAAASKGTGRITRILGIAS